MRLIIFLGMKQSANHDMLQKELITGSRSSATQTTKLLLKMPILNLEEISSNTVLFGFSLAKSDIRQLPWPKVKFKDDFLNILDFTLPFIQGPFISK